MKHKFGKACKFAFPLAIGLTVASGSTQALSLWNGINAFEDDNLEAQGVDTNNNGRLDIGDTLRGTITFTKQFDPFGIFATVPLGAPGEELTGIFETEVATKVIVGGSGTIADPYKYDYTFKAYSGFEAEYGTNAMVALFTQTPGDYYATTPVCGPTITQCETAATNGTEWMTFGLVGDIDNFWEATDVTGDIVDFSNVAASTKVGFVNYALSVLTNNTQYDVLQQQLSLCNPLAGPGDCLVDIIGSGDLLGGQGLTNGYKVRSDIDFQIRVVPTPGSLALLGLGLIGLFGARARRK